MLASPELVRVSSVFPFSSIKANGANFPSDTDGWNGKCYGWLYARSFSVHSNLGNSVPLPKLVLNLSHSAVFDANIMPQMLLACNLCQMIVWSKHCRIIRRGRASRILVRCVRQGTLQTSFTIYPGKPLPGNLQPWGNLSLSGLQVCDGEGAENKLDFFATSQIPMLTDPLLPYKKKKKRKWVWENEEWRVRPKRKRKKRGCGVLKQN